LAKVRLSVPAVDDLDRMIKGDNRWPPSQPRPARMPAYEVIHLGGQAAVVVPVADFLRLRALERAASPQELEDAEDTAAMLEWKARDAAGQTSYVPHDEVCRRLGLPW
jgi:hypothetical protein